MRRAFSRILNINYRPIYEIDVLDAIPEPFAVDTFDLIWGLEVENVRHDLPGRIFHELMPPSIRKMLAAFYTRPHAADILASLTIKSSGDRVFDPAAGSGTLLVSAYRRKAELSRAEGKAGNPHNRFCEEELFGADIMPFAVHLVGANLAAIDAGTPIERTQVILGDSLTLQAGGHYSVRMQLPMFLEKAVATDTQGNRYMVDLNEVDVILMNPPFTKVERGIERYVDMKRFREACGGEVGLWGHFLGLADAFLKPGGYLGAVLPINLLRGRESEKVRDMLFRAWTPLYIIKATRNYGFSEWAEYRDVLCVARKEKPAPSHKVKFCLLKKDLKQLGDEDISSLVDAVRQSGRVRTADFDIDVHPLSALRTRSANLMWFCGGSDFESRDVMVRFLAKFEGTLGTFPAGYFREGYRPVPMGVSKFLFLTRASAEARVEEAFLRFEREGRDEVKATSRLGVSYAVERAHLTPTLRTLVGLPKMDITGMHDFVAHEPYSELPRVLRACGFRRESRFQWHEFWQAIQKELPKKRTMLAVVHRINPFSPATNHAAYFSAEGCSPSNQANVVAEPDEQRAKAVCALLNSAAFYTQFFMLKEESTGRYINLRFYDLYEMPLFPATTYLEPLRKVFDLYKGREFPALRWQFDELFDDRYDEFWSKLTRGSGQPRLWSTLEKPVQPWPVRLEFDLAIAKALGVEVSREELLEVYSAIVKDMVITRHLLRD